MMTTFMGKKELKKVEEER